MCSLSYIHVYRIEYVSYRQGPYRIRIVSAADRIVPALKGIIWFKRKMSHFSFDDISVCGCYIPPAESQVYTNSSSPLFEFGCFDQINRDIIEYSHYDDILTGDLNARTGQKLLFPLLAMYPLAKRTNRRKLIYFNIVHLYYYVCTYCQISL